jgi:hypothetical protein
MMVHQEDSSSKDRWAAVTLREDFIGKRDSV